MHMCEPSLATPQVTHRPTERARKAIERNVFVEKGCMMRRAFLSTLPRLATRRQAFKEHVWSLRQQDPERWTTPVLAHHFKVPVENMHAMLVLKELEVEAGSIDEELTSLAEDAEEYLDSEYALDPAPSDSTEGARPQARRLGDVYDREQQQQQQQQQGEAASAASDGDLSLERMSYEEERALISAVASRFGGNDDPPFGGATPALGSRPPRRALQPQLGGDGSAARAGGGAAAATDAGRRGCAARSGSPPSPRAARRPSTRPCSRPMAAAARRVRQSRPPAAAGHAGRRAAAAERRRRGVLVRRHAVRAHDARRALLLLAPHRRRPRRPRARRRRRGSPAAPRAHGRRALSLAEMRAVGVPDFGARLRQNVERRARLLAPDAEHYPYRNRGRYLFADITRGGRRESTPQAKRAWVSQRGAPGEGGTTREPTEASSATRASACSRQS